MRRPYIATIQPSRSAQEHKGSAHACTVRAGRYLISVDGPDALPADTYNLAAEARDRRAIFREGYQLAGGDPLDAVQPGIYNRLVVCGDDDTAVLANDAFGVLPCFWTVSGEALILSNSLNLLRERLRPPVNEHALACMFFFSGWAPGSPTIYEGVFKLPPGRRLRFRLDDLSSEPAATIMSRLYAGVVDMPERAAMDRIVELWQQAIDRVAANGNGKFGVMLSGGLDSRLVAGGIGASERDLYCLTHGNLDSAECDAAAQVAATLGATFVGNALDESFSFDELALEANHRERDSLFNPMWRSSAALLAGLGVAHFATGSGLDFMLGGHRDKNKRRRLTMNLASAAGLPWHERILPDVGRDYIIAQRLSMPRRRMTHFVPLLSAYYREVMTSVFERLPSLVAGEVAKLAADHPVTGWQLRSCFYLEHKSQYISDSQERALFQFGRAYIPGYDPDLTAFLTNLNPRLMFDHSLYYKVIRRLYPDLARIPVANLGTHIAQPQLAIELIRFGRIAGRRRTSSWVNFNEWIRLGDNLERLEAHFLAAEHFFDPDGIRDFFVSVRAGRDSLFDGNAWLGFLNLAWLAQDSAPELPDAA